MATPTLMQRLRRVGRCARALTHPRSALALVLATALRRRSLSAGAGSP
jgi:hypothetical protein